MRAGNLIIFVGQPTDTGHLVIFYSIDYVMSTHFTLFNEVFSHNLRQTKHSDKLVLLHESLDWFTLLLRVTRLKLLLGTVEMQKN